MIHKTNSGEIKIGDSLKNNKPYDGEGELIVASLPDESGYVKCVHALHVKHKSLNGMVELKPIDSLVDFYHKVE